ncbi:MAG: hypothetical protein Q4G70_10410 [Pseudomonadota bacterium]|nr:hypothetical protein [Pseudomonadota bacterium]
MQDNYPWSVLGLDGPGDERAIRRGYSRQVKVTRPDTDPEGFKALRTAYELALHWAESPEGARPPAAETVAHAPPEPEQTAPAPLLEAAVPAAPRDTPVLHPVPTRLDMDSQLHQVLHEGFVQDERDWEALAEAITSAELIEDTAARAQAARGMPDLVRRLLALPANQNLQIAQRTEELLIHQAAGSDLWPAAAARLVWEHYHLEDRLAFVPHWSAERHIQQRLEAHEQAMMQAKVWGWVPPTAHAQGQWQDAAEAPWQALRAEVVRQPRLPEAMLFRPLRWRDRLRCYFSPSTRRRGLEVLNWVRQEQPQHADELHQASARWLDQLGARMAQLPTWGVRGWMFMLACAGFMAAFLMPFVTVVDLGPQHLGGITAGLTALAWVLSLALKRWLLPWWRAADAARPRLFAVIEGVSAVVVIVCFGVGGVAPLIATAVAVVAAVVLLTCWAVHGRFLSIVQPPTAEDSLFGLLMLCALGLGLQSATALEPLWAIAPLAAAASLLHMLAWLPWMLHEPSGQYYWRAGIPFKLGAHALHALLAAALLLFIYLTVAPSLGHLPAVEGGASLPWAIGGLLLIYGAWTVLDWPPLWGVLNASGISGAFAFMLLVGLLGALSMSLNEMLGLRDGANVRVLVAALLVIQALRLSWRVRTGARAEGDS